MWKNIFHVREKMTFVSKAKKFVFARYALDPDRKMAVFTYEIEFEKKRKMSFTETIVFPKKMSIEHLPPELLDNVLSSVHLMLGISYYKLYCPPKIVLQSRTISKEQATFWEAVYRKGLGEFFYRNKLDPNDFAKFPHGRTAPVDNFSLKGKEKILLGIGGGKDSIVAGELLKEHGKKVTALLIETQKGSPIADAVVEAMDIPFLRIYRYLDEKIFTECRDAYNGHIPISAVFAFLGYLTAVLYGYSHIVVGNEYSSNFGNVRYKKLDINHQWSKSFEFEELFQQYTQKFLSPDIVYFSLLRPLYEIRIAEMFTRYPKYFSIFSSCNRNFKVHEKRQNVLWCGECAKCVFVFTMLSAFLKEEQLVAMFGKNLYADKRILPLFSDILGFGKMKPFDCVGTFDEARSALFLASATFGNLHNVASFLKKIKDPKELVAKVFRLNTAPTLPEEFLLMVGKSALILGYGKEGQVTEQYIKKYFPRIQIAIADKTISEDYLERQNDFEVVIKTPGISKRQMVVPYITATNLFFSQVKNTIIGVTGSKGKSTTSALIYSIFKEAGRKVRFLGNIGSPMLGALMKPVDPEEVFVLELSSYQLDDVRYSPHVAVVLNFFPEHMDYHGGVEEYYGAKQNIIKFQRRGDYLVYNDQDKRVKALIVGSKAHAIGFARDFDLSDIASPLRGPHNEENIRAVIAVARIFDISDKDIKRGIETFHPLPHRLECVGTFSGITFVDDAISTTPQSTMMALETIPNVGTIFLGGEDRGYDFDELEKCLRKKKIKNIVLFPDSGKRMLKSHKNLNVLETASMQTAVAFAYAHTPPKMTCLLSTASPSYSVWKNFEEKGDQFHYWVKKLASGRK